MYSIKRKEKYYTSINKSETTIQTEQKIISSLNTYEKSYKKDLCEFSIDDIWNMYKDLAGKSHTYYARINSVLKHYTDWCLNNNYYFGQNNYAQFSVADFIEIKSIEYYSESTLLSLCSKLINPVDKFIFLAPFYGFRNFDKYSDITLLRDYSFDVAHNEIKVNGRTIKVSPQLINYGLTALHTYTYDWGDGIRSNDIYGDGIIKYRNTKSIKEFNINMYISNKFNRVIRPAINDSNCTYKKIFDSGVVNFTCKHIVLNNNCDLLELWDNPAFQYDVITRFQIINKKSFLYVYGPKVKEALNLN